MADFYFRPTCRLFSSGGFTLLEFICILAIVAVLAISAYPVITDKTSAPLVAGLNLVMADIRLTQAGAMASGQRRHITFFTGSGKYNYDASGSDSKMRDLAEIGTCLESAGDFSVFFNSLGEPLPSSSFLVTLSCDGMNAIITIEQITGLVSRE